MATIEQRVREIIAYEQGIELHHVANESSLEDLGFDSLDVEELSMSLEEEFEIEIPSSNSEMFLTVQNVIDYIAKHCEPEH
jgi:acyl carrier protein